MTSALRPIVQILIAGLLCSACAAQSELQTDNGDRSRQKGNQPPSPVLVRTWGFSGGMATERGYAVDLAKREVTETPVQQIPQPEFARVRLEEKKNDRETYERIVARFGDTQGQTSADLASALDWIERSKSWGNRPEYSIVASPDGAYGVFTTTDKPVLLIHVATLATRRLVDSGGTYRSTPVAWSPDSQRVAFVPVDSKELRIYDVKQKKLVSTRAGVPAWVKTMAWSRDGRYIALLGMINRRMDINPFALLGAIAGHPSFRSDAVLIVVAAEAEDPITVTVKRGVSEIEAPPFHIEWK